jgi:hypothetical protein
MTSQPAAALTSSLLTAAASVGLVTAAERSSKSQSKVGVLASSRLKGVAALPPSTAWAA